MNSKLIKLFLRLSISAGFLSAVADRFGLWGKDVSVWGTWQGFVDYTAMINPWFPEGMIPTLAIIATAFEVLFAACLLLGFKTRFFANLSGILLLAFALSMAFSIGIKGPLDYSVFAASAAAFALGQIKEKFLELDSVV